jgi:hypothetical protein
MGQSVPHSLVAVGVERSRCVRCCRGQAHAQLAERRGAPAPPAGKLYDRKLLLQKLSHLKSVRAGGNIREMMFSLRADLVRNVANISKRCARRAAPRPPPTRPTTELVLCTES